MSLMIMGIGVVSLATLFPISTLRVLEATNLTNSTVARFNAEGIIDSFPQMIHNPDGDSTTREAGKNYIVDPLGWHELLAQGVASPVLYEYNRPTTGAFQITRPPISQQTRYLGDNVSSPALFTSIDIARRVASLQDTTTDFGEGFPDPDGINTAAYTLNGDGLVTGLTMPTEVDLSVFTLPTTDPAYQDPTNYQAVIFDVTGRYSEIRTIESVSIQTINWPSRPLPARYSSIVGLVRIERTDPFYSWMLTVRKRASGPANVDVVVFSKRDFNELSEQVYVGDMRRFTLGDDGVPGTAGVDLNNDGNNNELAELGYPGSDDQQNNRVTVDWDPSLYSTAPEKPLLRRGGFVFDAANALWYRVLTIEEAPTATSAVLALEKAISRNNTEDLIENNSLDAGEDLNSNGDIDRGGIIIPRGVVAVFPLETKLQQ
tara:strand:- start:27737 stop:29029 length:1293 start_codon:yes stop_codon:yes gene_type:complete